MDIETIIRKETRYDTRMTRDGDKTILTDNTTTRIFWMEDGIIWSEFYFNTQNFPKIYAHWNGSEWDWIDSRALYRYWDEKSGYWKNEQQNKEQRNRTAPLADLAHPLYALNTPCRFIKKGYEEQGWHEGWIGSIDCFYFDRYGTEQGIIYYRMAKKGSGHYWISEQIEWS